MNAPPDPDDPSSLIRVIAERRDQAAFARLFSTVAPRIKAYIMRLGAPPEAAEEIAQETMLTVWRKADRFDPARATGAAWIFAIARNLRIDVIRRDGGVVLVDDQSIEETSEPAIPDSLIAAAQRERRIRDALASLPPEQSDVIRLSFFDDAAHGEICRTLKIPLGTVKSRLRRAMARLRMLLDEDL